MFAKLAALILPLGLDTFVVAASLGAARISPNRRLPTSLLFAFFEAAMPLIGLALGEPLGQAIGGAAVYLAAGLLLALGLWILLGTERAEEERLARLATTSGIGMLILGVSISLDELAVGFTLGLLGLPVVLVIVLIAAQAFVVSQLGLRLGVRLSQRSLEGAERLAGLALSGLGLVLLAERLA